MNIFIFWILSFNLTVSADLIVPSSEPLPGDSFLKFVETLTYTTNIELMDLTGPFIKES